jgi:hypothetical protein
MNVNKIFTDSVRKFTLTGANRNFPSTLAMYTSIGCHSNKSKYIRQQLAARRDLPFELFKPSATHVKSSRPT